MDEETERGEAREKRNRERRETQKGNCARENSHSLSLYYWSPFGVISMKSLVFSASYVLIARAVLAFFLFFFFFSLGVFVSSVSQSSCSARCQKKRRQRLLLLKQHHLAASRIRQSTAGWSNRPFCVGRRCCCWPVY